jgi:hypothetical protein
MEVETAIRSWRQNGRERRRIQFEQFSCIYWTSLKGPVNNVIRAQVMRQ